MRYREQRRGGEVRPERRAPEPVTGAGALAMSEGGHTMELPETCSCGEEMRTLKPGAVYCEHCDRPCLLGQDVCERCQQASARQA